MPAPCILFVDDEEPILGALRDRLHRERHRWELCFALGGAAALEELARRPVDVVVTDMRMPGMDGAALLTRVKREHPGVARLVLSGQADHASMLRAIPVAHQFLSKPCPSGVLVAALERTTRLMGLLRDPAVIALAGGVDRLPSVPELYWEIERAAADPRRGIADIAAIVQRDPGMAAKVLQLVNSAYFGGTRSSSSIQGAVAGIGVEVLRALVLSAHVFDADAADPPGLSLALHQRRAVRRARLAARFIGDPALAEESFTVGLLADVGRVVLARARPEPYAEALALARQQRIPAHAAEVQVFGVDHAAVGAYLLGLWGLPHAVVEAVAYQHRPAGIAFAHAAAVAAVHVAVALTEAAEQGWAEPVGIDPGFLETSGTAPSVGRWKTWFKEDSENASRVAA